jgi:C1A family cysteine protease
MSRRYSYRPPPANHPFLATAPRLLTDAVPPALPSSIDLRGIMLPVRDQGQEGCCSGFSSAAFREALYRQQNGVFAPCGYLSPAYLYGRTRMAEGTFPADAGATLVDEFMTLYNYGVCPEESLPYNQNPAEAPTPACDVAAQPFRIPAPLGVPVSDPVFLKTALARNLPVAFGMPVYQSFESTGSSGLVAIPDKSRETLLGGHAMLAVGYDDARGVVIVRNSWGSSWGDGGYCYMPYAMISGWFEGYTITPAA